MPSFRYRAWAWASGVIPEPLKGALRRVPGLSGRGTMEGSRPRLAEGEVTFGGETFRWTAEYPMLQSAQRHGIERRISRLTMAELAPGGVGVDVGSSYGFLVMLMGRCVGPTGRVVAFEADPDVRATLERNVAANGLGDVVTVVGALVGDVDEPPARVTVDAALARLGIEHVDVMVVDTDGGDLAVLHGAQAVVERDHPVMAVEANADEAAICAWLTERYGQALDMQGDPVDRPPWPPNFIVADHPVRLLPPSA